MSADSSVRTENDLTSAFRFLEKGDYAKTKEKFEVSLRWSLSLAENDTRLEKAFPEAFSREGMRRRLSYFHRVRSCLASWYALSVFYYKRGKPKKALDHLQKGAVSPKCSCALRFKREMLRISR